MASYVWAGRVLDIDDPMGCWAYLAVSGLRFSREGISRGLGDGLRYDGWMGDVSFWFVDGVVVFAMVV